LIRDNIQSDKIIASNSATYAWFKTGIPSISLPNSITNQETFEKYIDHFGITYLVVYERADNRYKSENLPEKIMSFLPLNYVYVPQIIGNSLILEIKDVLEIDISNPLGYIAKAQKLERLERSDEAKKIFYELRNYNSDDKITEEICESYTAYHLYEESIYKCNIILQKDSTNLVALQNLAISFDGTGQKEKALETLDRYDELFVNSYSEQLVKSWAKTMDYLIQQDDSYQQITTTLFNKAKKLEEVGELQKSLTLLDQLSYVSVEKIDTNELKIRILTKLEKYEDAFETYDETIEIYPNEINKLHRAGQHGEANEMQKSMINLIKAKATLLINLEDYHKANRVYLELLGITKFDPDVYKKIAAYHEKYGQLRQALQNYEWALNLQPENDFLIEKIKELKDKIVV